MILKFLKAFKFNDGFYFKKLYCSCFINCIVKSRYLKSYKIVYVSDSRFWKGFYYLFMFLFWNRSFSTHQEIRVRWIFWKSRMELYTNNWKGKLKYSGFHRTSELKDSLNSHKKRLNYSVLYIKLLNEFELFLLL